MTNLKVILLLLITVILRLNGMSESDIKTNMKRYIEEKMQLGESVEKIDIISSYPIDDAPGWFVHFLSVKIKIKMGDGYADAILKKTVFTKGNRITVNLTQKGELKKDGTRKKGKSYIKLLKPTVPIDAYDDSHFLIGNRNAPHKIVFFSDPFCPYCAKKFPEIIDVIKKNPKTYGLYYYHLPLLKIHPASDVVTKAMHIFHKRGEVDNMLALYNLSIDAKETDVNKILKAIRDRTGVLFTQNEIFSPAIREAMRVDMAMKQRLQVTGTPTIFIDGKWDRLRTKYKEYAK